MNCGLGEPGNVGSVFDMVRVRSIGFIVASRCLHVATAAALVNMSCAGRRGTRRGQGGVAGRGA